MRGARLNRTRSCGDKASQGLRYIVTEFETEIYITSMQCLRLCSAARVRNIPKMGATVAIVLAFMAYTAPVCGRRLPQTVHLSARSMELIGTAENGAPVQSAFCGSADAGAND